jgi:hypothetical protein
MCDSGGADGPKLPGAGPVLWMALTPGNDIRSGDQGWSNQEAHRREAIRSRAWGPVVCFDERTGPLHAESRPTSRFHVSRATDITGADKFINQPSGQPMSKP